MKLTIKNRQLPTGWRKKKLGDVCDLQNGYAFKSKSYVKKSNTISIRMSNIRPNGQFDPEHNIKYLPDSFASEYSQFLVREGDLVVAMTDMASDPKILGLPTLINQVKGRNFLLNQRVGKLHNFSEDIDKKFLRFFLSSPVARFYLKSKGAGGLQININKKDILSITIPIPPLHEQKEIVEKLDEAFEGIDRAIANTEKNLANARELFNSYLNNIFTRDEDKWIEKTLGEICEIARGGSPRPIKNFLTNDTNGINWIKISDASASSKYIYETKEKIRPEGIKSSRLVQNGDLLLSNSMSFGRPYIMKTSGCIHDGWLVLREKSGLFNEEFLYYYLGSNATYKQFDYLAAGSTVRNLNINLVKKVKVILPTLSQQREIVQALEQFSIETQRLEAIYQRKLEALQELKQSLLHKAFTGELTNPSTSLRNNPTVKEVAA